MENTQPLKADEIVKIGYKTIGKHIGIARKLSNMKAGDFNRELGSRLGYSEDTIRGFFSKGVTGVIDEDELLSALGEMLESSIAGTLSADKEKYIYPLYGIAFTYELIEFSKYMDEMLSDDVRMRMTVESFMLGLWPENSEGLNRAESDYLRESLKCYSSHRRNVDRIITTYEEIHTHYDSLPKDREALLEMMHDRAWKKLFATAIKVI